MKNTINLTAICLLLMGAWACTAPTKQSAPTSLVVSEGFNNPLGFYDATPTFSWQLPVSGNVQHQSAHHIVVASSPEKLPDNADIWDSKKQSTQASTWVPYGGKALQSRQKVYWQVRFWDENDKASAWSDTNHFELGLLDNEDWKAQWVGLDTAKDSIRGRSNVLIHKPQYLRKTFSVAGQVAQARLYITAKGVFDVHLNGNDVSDDVMPPGWTPYNKRIETLTYDVTDLIASGKNAIGVELASGWHSGRLLWGKTEWDNSLSPKVLCQLEIRLRDGSTMMVLSDESWKGVTKGPIAFSEIYDGEVYDANKEMPNWSGPFFEDADWDTVEVAPLDSHIALEPKRHTTVKTKLTLTPKEVAINENSTVFDLGQNMVGVPRVKVPMKKGDTLVMRFAEMLGADGSFHTKNYRSAHSTNYYVAAEDGPVDYTPKFTFYGFRYVQLSGYDQEAAPIKDWVTGLVQYSDFEDNGTFTSSHDKLNQLQSNIVWGLRGNFFDIPTDCPQRDERLGWTGDAQVFGPTSVFNAHVHKFWASWLQSVRESQWEDGGIPWTVPDTRGNYTASSGWGDVVTIIPWKIYMRTGDTNLLEANYEMMKEWVRHHGIKSKDHISHMMSFSDWLQPYPENGDNRGDTSLNLIGTAFYARSAQLTAKTAKVLGKLEEAAKYNALYKTVAAAFDNAFFDEAGTLKEGPETQTSYLLALAFDLLPQEKRKNAQMRLLQKIKDADNHLRTGFLGTPLLSKVLDDMGETDLMYQLLFNETYPSWFYSINQGATTIWERWNSYSKEAGFNPKSMNSLNHYAYGAIGEWLYERIAGIAPLEAGYKRIKIAPLPNASYLNSASARVETPYGKASSGWTLTEKEFTLETEIPPNTIAVVHMPNATVGEIRVNDQTLKDNPKIKQLSGPGEDTLVLEVPPGSHTFSRAIR
ncbi:family 78 glycoside hydrolase catalytic domain [Maribacter sp. 2307ULW6-5]|uniref:alpha-L-rhamnosidase n=1 Tax=Maribacter sp. 2307ULW6-5 TaxID=3386275 RepID=UPI0039BD7887